MNHYDVVIVGGGIMGCSCAYYLIKGEPGLKVAVVEKDATYQHASTTLSLANVRVQFSLKENIEISRYTLEVIKDFAHTMSVSGEEVELFFRPEGNLFLAEQGADQEMKQAMVRQQKLGGAVEWWSGKRIKESFPLFNTTMFSGGNFGYQDGHMDAYAFLQGYRKKARSLGVTFFSGEVSQVLTSSSTATGVRLLSGSVLKGKWIINCAGAWAAPIAATAAIKIPVISIKRQVFVAAVQTDLARPLPLTNLPSGLYFRSEGRQQIVVGKSLDDDPAGVDFEVDENRFYKLLWPELTAFVPAFDRLKLLRGWSGLYAENTFDGNAILGEWPELEGFVLVNGFSGHGFQQAPAVGRYISEIVLQKKPSFDLSIFSPARLFENQPIRENLLV